MNLNPKINLLKNIKLDHISSRGLQTHEIDTYIKDKTPFDPLPNLTIPRTPKHNVKKYNPAAANDPLHICNNFFEIKIPSSNPNNNKCLPFNHPDAIKFILDVYKNKPNIIPHNIYGPRQGIENCWFNGFFMSFFIGDLPMKFISYYRKFMILGTDSNGRRLIEPIRRLAWGLNFLIEYTLRGKIVKPAKDLIDLSFKGGFRQKYGDTGNPLILFDDLLSRIEYNKVKIADVFFTNSYQKQLQIYNQNNNDPINDIDVLRKMKIVKNADIIFLKVANNTPYKKYLKLNNSLYELGSAMFQVFLKNPNDPKDKGGFHLISGIKINNEYYLYDSNETSSGKKIRKYDWMNKFVENKTEDILAFDTTIKPHYIRYYFYYRIQ
jgi:hypothetical protein